MFSNRAGSSQGGYKRWWSVVTLLALATFSIQCGKKGPPKPPPSKIPSPITDLKVQQRGMEMVLRMGYPTTTIGGLPLETVEAVEVWEMKRIIPAFTDSPELSLEQTGDESASDYVDEGSDETDTTLVEDVAEIEEPEDPDEGLLFRMATDEADEDEVPKEDQIEVDPREFELVSRLSWSIREPDLRIRRPCLCV
jgi:predicted small lipoprotein YifL